MNWYPMYCTYGSELKVKVELDRLKVENYLPMVCQQVEHNGEKHREMVPAIRNLIFVHESQQEIERNDEYSILTYQLRPSYDFIQELLWNGADMEVLKPQSLRQEIASIVEQLHKKYKR